MNNVLKLPPNLWMGFHSQSGSAILVLVVAALEVDVSKHGGAPFDFNTGLQKRTRRNEADVSFHPQIS